MSKTFVAAAVAALTLLAAPAGAHAKGAAANPTGCTPLPALEHPFAPWGDAGSTCCTPAATWSPACPAGRSPAAPPSWTAMTASACAPGKKVLRLPAGATAVTSPICIDETFTHARLLARSTGAVGAKLNVDVLYTDTKGKSVVKGSKSYSVNPCVGADRGTSTSTPSSTGRRRCSSGSPPRRTRAGCWTTSTSTRATAARRPAPARGRRRPPCRRRRPARGPRR